MEKQRKFLLVLPLLVIPFMTMAFWALGGGKKQNSQIVTAVASIPTCPKRNLRTKIKRIKCLFTKRRSMIPPKTV